MKASDMIIVHGAEAGFDSKTRMIGIFLSDENGESTFGAFMPESVVDILIAQLQKAKEVKAKAEGAAA